MNFLVWGSEAPCDLSWDDAMAWCATQGDGWRAPLLSELIKALEDGELGFDGRAFWSSYASSSLSAWYVSFEYGGVFLRDKKTPLRIRCVREKPGVVRPESGPNGDIKIADPAHGDRPSLSHIGSSLCAWYVPLYYGYVVSPDKYGR